MSKTYEKYLPFAGEEEVRARIIKWNLDRNGLEFNPALEMRMLIEECAELMEATNLPNYVKEVCDILFVAFGCEAKDKDDSMKEWMNETIDLMAVITQDLNTIFSDTFKSYPEFLEVCMAIVTEANEQKGTERDVHGKVVKGPRYVNPEFTIKLLLEEMRIGY